MVMILERRTKVKILWLTWWCQVEPRMTWLREIREICTMFIVSPFYNQMAQDMAHQATKCWLTNSTKVGTAALQTDDLLHPHTVTTSVSQMSESREISTGRVTSTIWATHPIVCFTKYPTLLPKLPEYKTSTKMCLTMSTATNVQHLHQ